jgi:hypothetical protein
MRKHLTTLTMLSLIATPALAQSFDPDIGTGNVLSFGAKSAAPQSDKINVRQTEVRAYAMMPSTPAHVRRHKQGAAHNQNWRFAPGVCAVPEVNDAVGVWLPPQCER